MKGHLRVLHAPVHVCGVYLPGKHLMGLSEVGLEGPVQMPLTFLVFKAGVSIGGF